MVVGTLGNVVFETSRERALSFAEVQHDAGMRVQQHEVIGRRPVTEVTGPEGESISFALILSVELGVDPDVEYTRLYDMLQAGLAVPLIMGGKPIGGAGTRWILQRLAKTDKVFRPNGRTVWREVALTLVREGKWEDASR